MKGVIPLMIAIVTKLVPQIVLKHTASYFVKQVKGVIPPMNVIVTDPIPRSVTKHITSSSLLIDGHQLQYCDRYEDEEVITKLVDHLFGSEIKKLLGDYPTSLDPSCPWIY
jgi:hypothetical protein